MGGLALVLLLLLSFLLSKSRRTVSALAVSVVIQSSELARFCVEGSGFLAFLQWLYLSQLYCIRANDDLDCWGEMRCRKEEFWFCLE